MRREEDVLESWVKASAQSTVGSKLPALTAVVLEPRGAQGRCWFGFLRQVSVLLSDK